MKIKKVFAYMGSKGRFYKEIKKVFEENYRETFIDLFAGGMEVPLNLKADFQNLEVIANVRDMRMELMLGMDSYSLFSNVVKEVYRDLEMIGSRIIYTKDKKKFNILKANFLEILNKHTLNEQIVIRLLGGVGGESRSLSSNFYSKNKLGNLKIYLESMRNIKIQTDYFNEKWEYENSFIFLDPPYLSSTKSDGKKGYNYEEYNSKDTWKEEDNIRLVEFIKRNREKNNIFMIFGSVGNHLQTILRKEFSEIEFHTMTYKKSIFGCSSVREEWYCLIK